MIKYEKMDLFLAPEGSILVHACNSRGIWGSGIAKEFKKRFPKSFEFYNAHCRYHDEPLMFPMVLCPEENDYRVACLITSDNYGDKVDPEYKILKNTENALKVFFKEVLPVQTLENRLCKRGPVVIYSNKFNSGLFKVPWKKTEAVLNKFLEEYDVEWVVCDPNLK